MSAVNIFARLTKVDEERRLVYGRAADEAADKQDEVFDYATCKPHFEAWSKDVQKDSGGKSLGNVRAMHGSIAAGKLTQILFNDAEKAIDVTAHVVDDAEWNKVLEGVYMGFSIGGKYVKKWPDGAQKGITRYTAKPSEISLVDRPANPSSVFFDIVKKDGSVLKKEFSGTEKTAEEKEADVRKADLEKARAGEDCSLEAKKAVLIADHGETLESLEKLDEDAVTEMWLEKVTASDEGITEVAGTAEDVATLGKLLGDHGITVSDVIDIVTKHVAKPGDPLRDLLKSESLPVLSKDVGYKDLRKGLSECASFLYALDTLNRLCKSCAAEAIAEGDDSPIPGQLKVAIYDLGKIVAAMLDEELEEAHTGKDRQSIGNAYYASEAVKDLVKTLEDAGVTKSDMSAEHMGIAQKVHECCTSAGVKCDLPMKADGTDYTDAELKAELVKVSSDMSPGHYRQLMKIHNYMGKMGVKCASDDAGKLDLSNSGDLAKMIAQAAGDAVAKALADSNAKIADLTTKLTIALAKPQTTRLALRAVSKGDDVSDAARSGTGVVNPVMGNDGEVNKSASAIKNIHASGGTIAIKK